MATDDSGTQQGQTKRGTGPGGGFMKNTTRRNALIVAVVLVVALFAAKAYM